MKLISLIVILTALISVIESANCPKKSENTKEVPDLLSNVKGQNGYQSLIEIFDTNSDSFEVNEYYSSVKQSGWFTFMPDLSSSEWQIHYYQKTSEKFEIYDEKCSAKNLDNESKLDAVKKWIQSEEVQLAGNLEILGPTALMVYAKSIEANAQYMGIDTSDGQSLNHWFACTTDDGPYIDFLFDQTNKPVRFSYYYPFYPEKVVVFNFIKFEPLKETTLMFDYPFGYGCVRTSESMKPFPWVKSDDTFALDMEAVIVYENPDRSVISSARIVKYQKTMSFEITDESKTTQIVQNGDHLGRYIIDPVTGQCTLDKVDESEVNPFSDSNHVTTWPYHSPCDFNLLYSVILDNIEAKFMGTVYDEALGFLDVYEQLMRKFFQKDLILYVDAVADYYFPSGSLVGSNTVPSKIIIKPINFETLQTSQQIPSIIEIETISYSKEINEEHKKLFDVSDCYTEPGQFVYFQLLFPDCSPVINGNIEELTNAINDLLSTFIPRIRLPEIKLIIEDLNVYASFKLLDRPPFEFHYSTINSFIISNPTKILVREHVEDCGQTCTDDNSCFEFSYCRDESCQIFTSESMTSSYVSTNVNCTWYRRTVYDNEVDIIERNILASTSSILHQLNQRVNSGTIVLPKFKLSATDLFLIRHPDEIGSASEEFNGEGSIEQINDNNYQVIETQRKLQLGSSVYDISYQQCLLLCSNDDDCFKLSYCSYPHQECILSSSDTNSVLDSSTYADNCNVFEKSFLSYYREFPGVSLVFDSIDTILDIDEAECAHSCYKSDLSCKSFDYCTYVGGEAKGKVGCFLHAYHTASDKDHLLDENVWDFSESQCSHYSRQFSQDYSHLLGVEFNQQLIEVIGDTKDVSLEQCAAECNQSPYGCKSYEYCENLGRGSQSGYISSCRLSVYKPSGSIDEKLETSSSYCSVYTKKGSFGEEEQESSSTASVGFYSFIFMAAFVSGAIGSVIYKRRRSR